MIREERQKGLLLSTAVTVLSLAAVWVTAEDWAGEASWPFFRAVLFALVGGGIAIRGEWKEGQAWGAAAALGGVAIFGWSGLDWALAILAGCSLRLSREALTRICLAVSVLGFVALAANREWGPLPFTNRNHFSVFVEVVLPFLAWRVQREESKLSLLAGSLLLAVSFGAGSRMGALVLGGEVLWLAWKWGGLRKAALGGLAMVALGSIFVLGSEKQRLLNPWAGDHRKEIWSSAVEMIAAKPWTGWGVDAFAAEYPAYAKFDNGERVNAVHSDWLEWGVEMGWGGILLPLGALGVFLKRYARFLPVWGILFGAIHAAVDFPWQGPGFVVASAVILGSFAQYAQKTSRTHPSAAESANLAG